MHELGDEAVHRVLETQADKLAFDEVHAETLRALDAPRGQFPARQRLAEAIVVFNLLRLFERTDAVRSDRDRRAAALRVNSRRNARRPLSDDKKMLHA